MSSWFLLFGNEKVTQHQEHNLPNSPPTNVLSLCHPWSAHSTDTGTLVCTSEIPYSLTNTGLHWFAFQLTYLAPLSSYLAMQCHDLLTMDLWWIAEDSSPASSYRASEKLKMTRHLWQETLIASDVTFTEKDFTNEHWADTLRWKSAGSL